MLGVLNSAPFLERGREFFEGSPCSPAQSLPCRLPLSVVRRPTLTQPRRPRRRLNVLHAWKQAKLYLDRVGLAPRAAVRGAGTATVTPDTTVRIGSTLLLRAEIKDESGTSLDHPVIWESSNPALVRVEANGRVTAQGPGRVYVRARFANHSDSLVVTVAVPAPAPLPVARDTVHRPDAVEVNVPPVPTVENVQAAIAACGAALGSGDERRIVEVYKAETAQDVANLRKILDLALRKGAELTASEFKAGAPAATAQKVMYPLQVQFTWRNNAGVGKKKEIPFRLEVAKTRTGWQLGSCRATEKVGF